MKNQKQNKKNFSDNYWFLFILSKAGVSNLFSLRTTKFNSGKSSATILDRPPTPKLNPHRNYS